jgi:hypothetical protein
VLTGLAGPYCGKGVPVVGRGNGHGVYIFVVEGSAKVILGRRRKLLNFADFLNAFCVKIFVNVNEGFDADIWDFGKSAGDFHTPAANADDGDVDTLIGADYTVFGNKGRLSAVAGNQGVGRKNAARNFSGIA